MKWVKPYQFLAVQRAEASKALSVSFSFNAGSAERLLEDLVWRCQNAAAVADGHPSWDFEWRAAIHDALKRLIRPSLEREWRRRLREAAEDDAFDTYRRNIWTKLLSPPLRMHPEWGGAVVAVLGIDPAYRTGCKLALVDATGHVVSTCTVYPHPSNWSSTLPAKQAAEAASGFESLLMQGLEDADDSAVLLCSVGNGTASRETEAWLRKQLKAMAKGPNPLLATLGYVVVDEAGASVYSASPLAGRELPDLDVSMRGAVSIARRLLDPLAELVKIDPRSIGVGLYQHDVDQKRLARELRAAVEDCVNAVGVDLNTASPALLEHVAGLSTLVAQAIVTFRSDLSKAVLLFDL